MAILQLLFASKEESLSVRRFRVREAMSEPFVVDVVALSPHAIDLEGILGHPAGLLLEGGALAGPRVWTGVCSRFELLMAEPSGLSTYAVQIAAMPWLLGHRRSNRIFEHQTIPDIVKAVLSDYQIVPDTRLSETHEEHEYRVQLGETDLDFIHRLLEEEGISYFFEQIPQGKGWVSRMVLADKPEAGPSRADALPFVQNPNREAREAFVTRVRVGRRVRPGRYLLRDFDFVRPGYRLDGKATPAPAPEDDYERYAYEPAAFIKDRKGKHRVVADKEASDKAEIALGALRHGLRHVAFGTNALDLSPGSVLSMTRHPRAELGRGKLLALETTMDGKHDDEWTMEVHAAFASQRYRPPQRTAKPRVPGPESAVVVGPRGQEIHTDEWGRVRVQFHWDRQHNYDEQASCWVRVGHGWGGAAFGMHMLPRIGQEVMVDFFDGDPDQPVVTGRVHNARTKVPYKLPQEKTRSTWKSDSTPQAEGFNEIMLEDKAGQELLYVQAQRNLSKLVKKDETERTGANRLEVVGANRTEIVAAVDSTLVGAQHLLATVSPTNLKILTLDDPDLSIQATAHDMVDGRTGLTTGKATTVLDGQDITLDANGTIAIQSGGDVVIEGGHVYLNTKPVASQRVKAQADLADKASRPKGRMLGAIKDAFQRAEQGPIDEGGQKEKEVVKTVLPVPHRIQVGGTCGIAALGMVLDYWHAKDGTQKNPPDKDILALAQSKGWSKTGETTPSVRSKLAQEYGYDSTYKMGATMADLKKAVADGTPPIIAFNVDKAAGDPQWTDLDRGHAAVVKGFTTKNGKEYVVATHGWGSAETREWPAEDFEKSWATRDKSMVIVKPKPPKKP